MASALLASALHTRVPSTTGSRRPVVILRLRDQDQAGGTVLHGVDDDADALRCAGGKHILSGVSAKLMDQTERTGHLGRLGPERFFSAKSVLHHSPETAFEASRHRL
jgi:hypothetical protein